MRVPSPVTLAPEIRGRTTQNLRVFDQKILGLGRHLRRGDHALVILREPDRRDRADIDAVVVDLGLAGLEPLGRLEYDRDLRAFAAGSGSRRPRRRPAPPRSG